MIISEFMFEDKKYVIELQDNQSLVFYRFNYDSFSFFSKPELSTRITHDIENPIKLLRLIFKEVETFLYDKKIKFFYLTANDVKRQRIYMKFLGKLRGYNFQASDETINVFKENPLKAHKQPFYDGYLGT